MALLIDDKHADNSERNHSTLGLIIGNGHKKFSFHSIRNYHVKVSIQQKSFWRKIKTVRWYCRQKTFRNFLGAKIANGWFVEGKQAEKFWNIKMKRGHWDIFWKTFLCGNPPGFHILERRDMMTIIFFW